MNRLISASLFIAFILYGCGQNLPAYQPLEERLLRIVEIFPASGDEIEPDGHVTVRFSREINPATVGDQSISVVNAEGLEGELSEMDSEEVGEIASVAGHYSISEGNTVVVFQPDGGFGGEGEHNIIINNNLRSVDGLSFGDSKKPFISSFYVIKSGGDSSSGDKGESDDGPPSPAGSGTGDSSGADVGENADKDEVSEQPQFPKPDYLYINEIYYDAAGSDTNGEIFIELYGEAGGYLEGYYIALVNGDDGETYKTVPVAEAMFVGDDALFVIADTDSDGGTLVEGADLLSNFDPQNGPDTVQLIDPDGGLVDVVGYGAVPMPTAKNGLSMYLGTPAEDPDSGKSLSRIEGATPSGDNSMDFIVNQTPSPGSFDVSE